MNICSREESFGRAMGALDVISQKHFEKGKPVVTTLYLQDFDRSPMTVYYRAFKDVTLYASRFDVIDLAIMDRAMRYISSMKSEDYNDTPLAPTHLIFASKESLEIEELVKQGKLVV